MDTFLRKINVTIAKILDKALLGEEISVEEGTRLFTVGHKELAALIMTADELRQRTVGNSVTFVHNRNINFTNYCVGTCLFCGFRRRPGEHDGFLLDLEEIVARAEEANRLGATEVCIQGGLHPDLDPNYYLQICETIKANCPEIHIHAFSPMEIFFVSRRAGWSIHEFLRRLKISGLDSMPGTAAEILEDSVREILCPEKLTVSQWEGVITHAHRLGIRTSATMMYGHVEQPWHRVVHLDLIRSIHKQTGGFTEFVPLSFVYPNTELYQRGLCGSGASGLTDLKVHAIARIMLNGWINNIQTSWVKLGKRLAQICLDAGGNDLGGTLMEENISRSAGSSSPQQMSVEELKEIIRDVDRTPAQRTTTYEIIEVFQ